MNEAKALFNCQLDGMSLKQDSGNYVVGDFFPKTTWDYWERNYYPTIIKETYPVYLQERAKDEGKKAFEILKALMDKKLIKLDKVSDFVEAMDTLIKIV